MTDTAELYVDHLLATTRTQAAEIARLREALIDISMYGCGMLNQPMTMNGPEEEWLRMRIRRYEHVAHNALAAPDEGEGDGPQRLPRKMPSVRQALNKKGHKTP
jgi:hypothetical protein